MIYRSCFKVTDNSRLCEVAYGSIVNGGVERFFKGFVSG